MNCAALAVGVAAVFAGAPEVAAAGNVESQVVSQSSRSQVVRQGLVRSALVESAVVESAVVRSAALYPHKASVAQRVKVRLAR